MAKRTFSSFTKYLYPFLLTLVLFSFPSGAAHAQPSSPTFADLVRMSQEKEVIHHFDVTASADKEGFVTVREKIELTALGKEIKRGIIRVFPTDYETADGMIQRTGFELLSTTLDGAPVQNYVEREGGNIEIRLGSSDIILERGRHVYEITYKTRGWIAFREEFDEFYWNVTGNDWIFPIQKASYRVTLPDGGQVLKFAGFTGYKGESGEDFRRLPDGSFETTRPLKKGEGLSITVAWEKGLVEMPPLPLMEKLERMFHFNRGPAITFFVVITALYYAAAWLWKGRDKPLGPVIPLFSPPAGVEAGYVKYFKDREYSTDALAANILQLAVDGAIRFSGEKDDLKIIPSGKSADELNLQSPLADVYRLMPAGRKMAVDDSSGPVFYEMEQKLRIAYLKRSKAHFASNLPLAIIGLIPLILLMAAGPWLGGAIMEFFAYDAGAGFYAAFIIMMLLGFVYAFAQRFRSLFKHGFGGIKGFEWIQVLILIFLSFMVIGILGLMLDADFVFSLGIIAITGIAFFFSGKIMAATTKEGAEMGREIEGLAMYIGTAERYRLPMVNPPEETPQLFEKLLPYAFALGLTKTWADSFSSILSEAGYAPEWSDSFTDGANLSMIVYGISGSIGDSRSSYSPPSARKARLPSASRASWFCWARRNFSSAAGLPAVTHRARL
jgi:hypothetical protein